MLFCIAILLIALYFMYRPEIRARRERKLEEQAREARCYVVEVPFSANADVDLIPFLEHASYLQIYIRSLLEHDLGKIPREKVDDCLTLPGICWNSLDELQSFELRLERDSHGDVIDHLEDMPRASRVDYIKRLICEDMVWRGEHSVLRFGAVAF